MKKFLTIISYTVLPVWLALVGLATYLWVTNDNSGDLMRLGLIDGGAEYTDSIRDLALPEVYYLGQDNDSLLRLDTCGVLVVGDSFSHGGGVGKPGDYVNYLAHESGRKVVVFTPPQDAAFDNPMQLAFALLNQGVIDSTNCPNLVVQEVERYLVDRHCKFVTSHPSIPRPAGNRWMMTPVRSIRNTARCYASRTTSSTASWVPTPFTPLSLDAHCSAAKSPASCTSITMT